jgi:hypothetical protein
MVAPEAEGLAIAVDTNVVDVAEDTLWDNTTWVRHVRVTNVVNIICSLQVG